MKRSVKLYTLGCKTNQYETQAIREELISSGAFIEAEAAAKADIYIVNTCTVTAKADRDCRWFIRHCRRENPDAQIAVTGCLTELDEDMIKTLPGVSFIVKNNEKDRVAGILTNHGQQTASSESRVYTPLKISDFEDRSRAFIKVQDGCDNICSYCKIPLVRGRSRSRDLSHIVEEVARLLDNGFKELVVTGICLGDWGRDLKGELKLHSLVEGIDAIEGNFRIRLSSIEPNMLTDRLIDSIANSKKVCPHLHVPLQSGSNRILRLMNRPYTAKKYIRIIRKAQRAIPDISITADVMVGFPGETMRDFGETVKVIRSIGSSRLHIFTYSERRGTVASRYNNSLNFADVKERREILEDIAKDASYKFRKRFLHKRAEGLIETERDPATSLLTGYTERYIRFLLDGPDTLKGQLAALKVVKVELKSTFCEYL